MGNFPYPNGFAGTKRVQQYINYLQEQNIRVSVLILMGKPLLPGNEEMEGEYCGVPYFVAGRGVHLGWGLPVALYRFFRDGTCFLRERKQKGATNILFHYGQPEADNIWFLIMARRMGYLIVHDLVEDYDLLNETFKSLLFNCRIWMKQRISRFIPQLSDGLVVISSHLENKYAGCGMPMIRIPIGAEVEGPISAMPMHNPVRIAYAGTFGTKDGIHVLLEAFQVVRKRYANCMLLLAGGHSSPLLGLPEELTSGVEYVGYLDDKAFYEFLNDADILCMTRLNSPYANAGFPFKLGEYLATGHPVVASQVSNIEEYLDDGRDILMVQPESIDKLGDALLFLLRNPVQAQEIGVNGRLACAKHFNPSKNGELLLGLLEKLSDCCTQEKA